MTGIVLCGGAGSRMGGVAKAFLRVGAETFIERLLGTLRPRCGELIVVAASEQGFQGLGAKVVTDLRPGCGPLMGLYTGLRASSDDCSFVSAVDAPLLSPALLGYMVEEAAARRGGRAGGRRGDQPCEWDALVPRWGERMQPLCAVYSRGCLAAIESVLGQGRLVSFYPLVRLEIIPDEVLARIDPDGLSFLNVNTPGDYARLTNAARKLWGERKSETSCA